jgi:hypothetical protein
MLIKLWPPPHMPVGSLVLVAILAGVIVLSQVLALRQGAPRHTVWWTLSLGLLSGMFLAYTLLWDGTLRSRITSQIGFLLGIACIWSALLQGRTLRTNLYEKIRARVEERRRLGIRVEDKYWWEKLLRWLVRKWYGWEPPRADGNGCS